MEADWSSVRCVRCEISAASVNKPEPFDINTNKFTISLLAKLESKEKLYGLNLLFSYGYIDKR